MVEVMMMNMTAFGCGESRVSWWGDELPLPLLPASLPFLALRGGSAGV